MALQCPFVVVMIWGPLWLDTGILAQNCLFTPILGEGLFLPKDFRLVLLLVCNQSSSVGLWMHYKSLHPAVTIWATLVNTHTHTHTRVTNCPRMPGTVPELQVCPASRAEAMRGN